MPSVYGARLTTFEDDEKESEYGYVRKVRKPTLIQFSFLHDLLVLFCSSMFKLEAVRSVFFVMFERLYKWKDRVFIFIFLFCFGINFRIFIS